MKRYIKLGGYDSMAMAEEILGEFSSMKMEAMLLIDKRDSKTQYYVAVRMEE